MNCCRYICTFPKFRASIFNQTQNLSVACEDIARFYDLVHVGFVALVHKLIKWTNSFISICSSCWFSYNYVHLCYERMTIDEQFMDKQKLVASLKSAVDKCPLLPKFLKVIHCLWVLFMRTKFNWSVTSILL